MVDIGDVGKLKYFLRRVQCTPGAIDYVKILRISLRWEWFSEYPYDWKMFGPPEEWYFADRAPKKKAYKLEHVIPEDELDEVDMWSDSEWDGMYENKRIFGWNQGWDGEGDDSLVKSASHFRSLVTPLIEDMKNLRSFHWGTNIIPLNAEICRALGKAEHLQEVSLGPCGQFYTSSEHTKHTEEAAAPAHACAFLFQSGCSQSPLWLIFEGRENRPLSCLYLNLEIFPSSRQFEDAEQAFGQRPDESLAPLADCYKHDRGVIEIPDPDRYLRYTYQDDSPESELNFVERPLAMFYRTMVASRGRLNHVQVKDIALARVKDLLPIWAQTALKGMDYSLRPQDFREDAFWQAVADLQPALASLMTLGHTQPSEESLTGLFQSREALQPLLPCIQGDRKLQIDLWNAFVEGQRTSLPDWTKPSLTDDLQALWYLAKDGETYIRDVPWY
jgi:hypothetical protein